MVDPRSIMLRSLRYHAPTEELRESFYVRGNTLFCSKPELLNKYCNTNTDQEQEVNVNSYVRKARQYHKNGGTGRKRIRGHKRKPTQQSLEERLFQAEPPDPFLPKAISYGIKNLYKYM